MLTAVLFHAGGEGTPAAIGCQVLPPEEMALFVAAVGGRDASFDYTLAHLEP